MKTATLPALREELDLLPGPVLPDGQPSWTLHDPARNHFFRIDWPTFEVLRRWHLGQAQAIADAVTQATTLELEAADVRGRVADLAVLPALSFQTIRVPKRISRS